MNNKEVVSRFLTDIQNIRPLGLPVDSTMEYNQPGARLACGFTFL